MEYSIQVIYLDTISTMTSIKKAVELGLSDNKYTEYELTSEYKLDDVWNDILKSTAKPLSILLVSGSDDALRLDQLIAESDREAFFISSYATSSSISTLKHGVSLYINDAHLPVLLLTYLKQFKFTNIVSLFNEDESYSKTLVEDLGDMHHLMKGTRYTQMLLSQESVSVVNSMAGSTVVISPTYDIERLALLNQLDIDLIIVPDLQEIFKYNGKSVLLACNAGAKIPHPTDDIRRLYRQFGDPVSGLTWATYSAANLLTRSIKLNEPLSKKVINDHWCTLSDELPYYQNNKYDLTSNNLLWGTYGLIFYKSSVKLLSSFFDTASPNIQKSFSSVLAAELIYDQDYSVSPQTLITFDNKGKQYQKFSSSSISLKEFTVGRNPRSVVPVIIRGFDNTIVDLRILGDVAFLLLTVIVE